MAAQIRGRTLASAFLAVLLGLVGVVFWIGLTGESKHAPRSAPEIAFTTRPTESPARIGSYVVHAGADAGALDHTVHDKKLREELRERLLEAWSRGEGAAATAAREGRFLPMPESDGGGRVDPAYIQGVMRGEYMPMATGCYEELLSRRKSASGTILAKFSIVGDEKIGGIIDDVTIETEGGLEDEMLVTCLRESLLGVAFRPPHGRGIVTVHYPIMMSPDEPDAG